MALYTITDDLDLTEPVLMQALSGWVDAGGAGTDAAEFFAASGTVVAYFDSEALFDYRSNRPVLDFVDGAIQELRWPEVAIRFVSVGGRDVLVLSGVEPDLRWQEFSSSVGDVATHFGVTRLISVGAVPAAVPHTLEAPVMTTASAKELLTGQRVPEGLLRVPGAAVSVVDHHFTQRGFETVGFWAQVPHYVTEPYKPAALALVAKVAEHLGLNVPMHDLQAAADEQRARLDETVASRPEARTYVQRLESMASAQFGLGDDVATEVERFLREVGGDNPFGE
jgi:predicted ATP-grasp superfamily ATP-dependent carboligase